jgi:branched-chain amino acid transport system substrate-binding protein
MTALEHAHLRSRRALRPFGLALAVWLAPLAAAHCAEVTVAQVAAFSGKLASASRDYNLGLNACLADHNVRAGANLHRVRLISRDDGFDPTRTAAEVSSLLQSDRPVAMVGFSGTRSVQAAMEAGLAREGVPVVGARSASSELRRLPGVFHLRPAHTLEVERLLAQLGALGVQRLSVVTSDDAYGNEALAVAERVASKHSVQLVGTHRYAARALDLSAAVAAALKVAPQAVLLVADTQVSADFVRRFRAVNRGTFVVAISDTEAEVLVSLIGPELARGLGVAQVTPDPQRGNRAVARDFRALMTRLQVPADRINHGSMAGYITCQVLLRALAKAGPQPTPASMTAALETVNGDLGGFTVSFGPGQREGSLYVDLSVIDERGMLRQ